MKPGTGKTEKLKFGTAGMPHCCRKSDIVSSVRTLRELGLDCMELEFVRGVYLSKEKAKQLREEVEKHRIALTVHAPYYINLNANEKEKKAASRKRIIDSAIAGSLAGAHSVTFHAAYFLGQEKNSVMKTVKTELMKIVDVLQKKKINIDIRPELTGKPVQVGSLEELIEFSSEVPMVKPCIDFAHLHARTAGGLKKYDNFKTVLNTLKKDLGAAALKDMHIHIAGIEYNEKGERKHLNLDDSDFNYKDLMRLFRKYRIEGCVICESPNIEEDALLLKKTYNS